MKPVFEGRSYKGVSLSEELTSNQEKILEENIVWAFGSLEPTSFVTRLLSNHFATLNQPLFALFLNGFLITKEMTTSLEFHQNRFDYFFNYGYKDIWQFYLRKLILNRIYAQFRDLSKKIIIKEPNGSLAADIIAECFPHSKIVIVLRDGRDIVDSKIDANLEEGWIAKRRGFVNFDRLGFIKDRARSWALLIQILMNTYEHHSDELRYLLRYEDLRKNTVRELQKIYSFLDIDIKKEELERLASKYSFENIPDDLKGKGKNRRSATPGKWKENFSDEEKKIMTKIMGTMLNKLGYNTTT